MDGLPAGGPLTWPRARRRPPLRPTGPQIARGARAFGLALALAVAPACGPEAPPAPPSHQALPELPPSRAEAELPREAPRPLRELTVALVGEVRGELEPCGCPTLPYGGFQRRQRLLDPLREVEPLLHLDAGELLLKGLATDREQDRVARAKALLELSREVGVDAWTPGPTDLLALGVAGLRGLAGAGPPALSATWQDAAGRPILPASAVLERGGVKVGVIGLSGAPTDPAFAEEVRSVDPVVAARAAVAALPEVDIVVALSNLPDDEAERVAAEIPGLTLVLSTRGQRSSAPGRPPAHGGSTPALLVEAADRGRYVSLVRLRLGAGPGAPLWLHPDAALWRDLRTARAQVRVLEGEGAAPERIAALKEGLAALEARFAEAGRGRNLVEVSDVPLASDLDGDAAVDRTLARFRAATLQRAAEVAAAPAAADGPTAYASSGGCVSCHSAEFARWAYTDHAQAWQSLVSRGAADNPECIGCHSTAFGQEGGWGELREGNIRRFKGVQCEACHGPMGGHPDNPAVVPESMAPARCVGCHDPANSPGFDYATYLARATCQGGSPETVPLPPPPSP